MIEVEKTVSAAAWVRAHADVLEVARERAGLEGREAVRLLRAFREDVHRHLGYGAFAEYTDRQLGYGHRTTQEKLRTAEALERLPELARALREGRLHASAVRELSRVATAETEAAWIDAASGRRMRDIERLVAGRARGDRPSDAQRPELERHVLRFEVSGETLAAFREATAWLREQSGEALDDDAVLLMLARTVLCGAGSDVATPGAATQSPPGRPKYQIQFAVCERCGRASQRAGADPIEISPAMLDAARCDASVRHDATATVHAHVGVDEPPERPRATIPPAVRRRVLERDQYRCRIPGCRHTLDLEVHHILPRADGGTHRPDDLVTNCGAHHRAIHAGRLHLSGTASALIVRHADGSPYGAAIPSAAATNANLCEKIFQGLRGLGSRRPRPRRPWPAPSPSIAIVPTPSRSRPKRS